MGTPLARAKDVHDKKPVELPAQREQPDQKVEESLEKVSATLERKVLERQRRILFVYRNTLYICANGKVFLGV